MTAYADPVAQHQTLAGSTADTVTIGTANGGPRFTDIEVYCRDLSNGLSFTYAVMGGTPAAAVHLAAGTYYVPPNGSLALSIARSNANIFAVSIAAAAATTVAYSVHGIPA